MKIINSEIKIIDIQRQVGEICISHSVDLSFLSKAEMTRLEDQIARRMIYEIRAKIAMKKFAAKTIRFPRDWLESLKERFLPQWARAKWPVIWEEITVEADAYHPDFAVPDKATFVNMISATRQYS